jgi:hypothetical protein
MKTIKKLLTKYGDYRDKIDTKGDTYFSTIIPWFVAGMCLIAFIASWPLGMAIYYKVISGIGAFIFPIVAWKLDKRFGYMKALHDHRLNRREIWRTKHKI